MNCINSLLILFWSIFISNLNLSVLFIYAGSQTPGHRLSRTIYLSMKNILDTIWSDEIRLQFYLGMCNKFYFLKAFNDAWYASQFQFSGYVHWCGLFWYYVLLYDFTLLYRSLFWPRSFWTNSWLLYTWFRLLMDIFLVQLTQLC